MERELAETGKKADDAGSRFEKFAGIMKGVGAAVGGAAIAAGAAAAKLGVEVIKSFGELEQNLGGSEAVFGQYAASIQKTGEDAYKNLGASQSEYLAIANKMGALFQGSGIEQAKSLELTEKAMQRAADMSSVMGIDLSMALESVAGAAKGNFTMMDNVNEYERSSCAVHTLAKQAGRGHERDKYSSLRIVKGTQLYMENSYTGGKSGNGHADVFRQHGTVRREFRPRIHADDYRFAGLVESGDNLVYRRPRQRRRGYDKAHRQHG
jgi:hypothetical protein